MKPWKVYKTTNNNNHNQQQPQQQSQFMFIISETDSFCNWQKYRGLFTYGSEHLAHHSHNFCLLLLQRIVCYVCMCCVDINIAVIGSNVWNLQHGCSKKQQQQQQQQQQI